MIPHHHENMIPAFNYTGEQIGKWIRINDYIRNEVVLFADMIFDVVPLLCGNREDIQNAKYGTHPNEEGCTVWAHALYSTIKQFIEEGNKG